jgi:hypothetical protein
MKKNIRTQYTVHSTRLINNITSLLCTTYYVLSTAPKAYGAITNTAVPGGDTPASAPKQFAVTMATLWQTIIIVGGLAFLMYFLYGGIQWIMAGGDKGKLEEAKGKITQGLVGLTILAASFVIVKFLQSALGLDLLNIKWPTAG